MSRIEKMATQETQRTVIKFGVLVAISCHIFACAFYGVGIASNGVDEWAYVDVEPTVYDRSFFWLVGPFF